MEPQHQIDFCHIQDTHWGGLTPLQRSSQCILQPLPTGRVVGVVRKHMKMSSFTNSSPWAGRDTGSIFKQSLTGLNSEFSFS